MRLPPRAEPSASDSGRPRHLFAKRFRHLRMYFVIAWWLAPGSRDTGEQRCMGQRRVESRVAERVPDSRQDVNGGGPGQLCVGSPQPAFLGVLSPHYGDISLATSLCRARWEGSSFTPHFPAPGKMRPCYLGGRGEWILVGHQQCKAQTLRAFILNLSCLLFSAS